MSLAAFLAHMADEERPRMSMPIQEAQIDNMIEVLERMINPPAVQVGEIVTLHRLFESRAEPWRGQPMIVIEVVSPHEAVKGRAPQPACLGDAAFRSDVAVLCQEPQGTLAVRAYDRRVLVPWVTPTVGADGG